MGDVRCLRGSASLSERRLSLARNALRNGCLSTWRGLSPPSPLEVHSTCAHQGQLLAFWLDVFIKQKSDASATFLWFQNDIRVSTKLTVVECVRSDGGGEFSGGASGELCGDRGIRQEFTTPDSPQPNGVVERGLAIVQEAAQAACLEAPRLFPDVQTPAAVLLGNDALIRSATGANPGRASSWSRVYGTVSPLSMVPFLKPGYCRVRRDSKAEPKAEMCFYLNGGSNHPSTSF